MEGLSVIKSLFLGNLPTFGLTTRDQANISLTCWKLYKVFTNQERALLATGMTLAEIKEQQDTSPYACKKCGLSRHLKCPLDIHGCIALGVNQSFVIMKNAPNASNILNVPKRKIILIVDTLT